MKIDHELETLKLVYNQYKESSKLIKWLQINATYANEFEEMFYLLENILNIDMQYGYNLDIIGKIIQQKRGQVDKDLIKWFGWLGNKDRVGYGQATWLPRDAARYDLATTPDEIYKVLLKAKAVKNTSACDVDSTYEAIEYIASTPLAGIDNRQDMTFAITFAKKLPLAERTVIQNFDVIPRAQGVKLISISEPADIKYFGYFGDPNSTAYGLEPYAQIIR